MSTARPAPLTLTPFRCLTDADGTDRLEGLTLDDLFDAFEKPDLCLRAALVPKANDPSKYQKPDTLAGFGTFAAIGNKRRKEAFEYSTSVALDFDGTTTIEEATERLRPVDFVGHTTFNHRVGGPADRFRVFAGLSRAIRTEPEYRIVWEYLNRLAGTCADEAARSVVNFWFRPGCPEDRVGDYARFRNLGEPVDVDAVVAAASATDKASAPVRSFVASAATSPRIVEVEAARVQAIALRSFAIRKLAAEWVPDAATRATTGDPRTRHQAKLALAGGLASQGFSEDAALGLMDELAQLVGDSSDDKRKSIVRSTYAQKEHDGPATGWPTLKAMIGNDAVDGAITLFGRAEHLLNQAALPKGFGTGGESVTLAVEDGGAGDELLFGPQLAEVLPPLDYLVAELGMVAGAGAPHLVAGYGYTGKTMALQSLLLSLASGRRVWGSYSAANASRVVHIDMEQGRRLTGRRYQRLALAMGVTLAELGDALAVAPMPRISLTKNHRARWRDLMIGRQVLLLDSLRAATGGQDESSSEIRSGLDMLGSLSEETGCRTICIHHARKPQKDDVGGQYAIRGSSAIFDACDGVYVFSAAKGDPVNVAHVKARSHGELVHDVALTIGDVPGAEGGDAKAGLEIKVLGADVVRGRKEERARDARYESARKDAETLRAQVAARPGLGANELRAAAGGMNAARFAAAKLMLGEQLETRQEKSGRTWKTTHHLRPAVDAGARGSRGGDAV